MRKCDLVPIVVLGLCILAFAGVVISTRVTDAAETEQVYYIIGYSNYWYTNPFNPYNRVPMTKVIASYRVLEVTDEQGLVVETHDLCYGGHYDFEVGRLYKITSKGNYWWAYRKITAIEILGDT